MKVKRQLKNVDKNFVFLAVMTELGALAMAVQFGLYLSYPIVVGINYKDMTDSEAQTMTNLSLGYKTCSGCLILLDVFSAILLLISM